MSEYFNFYAGKKITNPDGSMIFHIIGPRYDNHLEPIISRSRSFINNDIFDDYFRTIQIKEMDEELKRIGSVKMFLTEKKDELFSMAYWMSFGDLQHFANSNPTKGFVTLEEYEELMNGDASYYDADVKSFEFYAGLPKVEKDKYAFISFNEKRSPGYIFNHIYEVMDNILTIDDLCVIGTRG